jgi:hypothetical protein
MYGKLFQTLATKKADLDTDTVKVMLCTSSYTPDIDSHQYKNDITNEVSGDGYTAGGAIIDNTSISYDTTKHALVLTGDNVEWDDSTITARYGIVYDDTATDKPLIGIQDFGEDKSSSDGPFKLSWDSVGILVLTANPS